MIRTAWAPSTHRVWSIACVLLFLPSSFAHAFKSSEHCTLSNFALHLALIRQSATASSDAEKAVVADLLETFAADGDSCFPESWLRPGNEFSYGKIVALVDAQNTLDDVFNRYGSVEAGVESPQDLNQTYFGERALLMGRFSVAGHNNISHFQGLLMSSFARWHESAIITARRDTNIFQAIASQAIADHFLQDFFAPGHIVTPRDNFPDVVALSWHDKYNNDGLPLIVRKWPELRELARFAVSAAAMPGSKLDAQFRNIGERPQPDSEEAEGAIGAALATLEESRAEWFEGCLGDPKRDYRPWPELLAAVEQDGSDTEDTIRIICAHGDGLLSGERADVADQVAAQKLLIVLIQANYIGQVVDEYFKRGGRATFAEYFWCPEMTSILFRKGVILCLSRSIATPRNRGLSR